MGEFTSTEAIRYEAKFASANLINKSDEGYLRKKNSP